MITESVLKYLLRPYTLMMIPRISEQDLCFHISKFGILRKHEPTAIALLVPDTMQTIVDELWLHPPGHYTAWQKYNGLVYMYGEGRFGVHTAQDVEKITGEVHTEPGFSQFNIEGDLCCTFSLDGWALEARCEHKS